MKKIFSVTAIVGVMMAVAMGASAAPETGLEGTTGQPAVNQAQRISGQNDQRLVTPAMNSRERMEVQRALHKRAAAIRNKLLLESATEGDPQTGGK
jgi:hypothetical protein